MSLLVACVCIKGSPPNYKWYVSVCYPFIAIVVWMHFVCKATFWFKSHNTSRTSCVGDKNVLSTSSDTPPTIPSVMCQYAVFSFSDRMYGTVTVWYSKEKYVPNRASTIHRILPFYREKGGSGFNSRLELCLLLFHPNFTLELGRGYTWKFSYFFSWPLAPYRIP